MDRMGASIPLIYHILGIISINDHLIHSMTVRQVYFLTFMSLDIVTTQGKEFDIPHAKGIIAGSVGVLWPTRLIRPILVRLLSTYSTFTLDTPDPITSIAPPDSTISPYVMHTPRLEITTTHILYATMATQRTSSLASLGRSFPFALTTEIGTVDDSVVDRIGLVLWDSLAMCFPGLEKRRHISPDAGRVRGGNGDGMSIAWEETVTRILGVKGGVWVIEEMDVTVERVERTKGLKEFVGIFFG
ncbi:hypothetical protein B9Z19DRAFT_1133756 [Tuber borchii]|uniref:Uncharacterized protein n=1 Tax=Tuber borchii TaxID=42251 RepID=A0A2T6ZFC0_TUBBO|nr:hypothetical protein B9Z19DRAFT_1133756 [Tuber borchii]